jgi:branched-chain amino acid transport system substrate-binding protein
MSRRNFLAAGCASLAAALGAGGARANLPIVVGRTLPLSGQLRAIGELKKDGGDAFMHGLNVAGGIRGRAVELITLDDGYLADRTVANLRQLATQHNPVAFLGLLRLPAVDGALPLLEELKIPAVGVSSATHLLRARFNRYGFPVRASVMDEGRKIASHIRSTGLERVAVIFQDVPLGHTTRASVEAGLKEVGLGVTAFALNATASDAAAVARAAIAAQPQAIFLGVLTPAAAALITELRRAAFAGALYTFSSTDAVTLHRLVGNQAMGIAISQIVPIPDSARLRVVADYVRAVAALGRGAPTMLGLEGYMEAKVLAEGLKRTGAAVSPESLVKALETLGELDLGGFFVRYTPQARTGSLFVEVDMIGNNGRLIR